MSSPSGRKKRKRGSVTLRPEIKELVDKAAAGFGQNNNEFLRRLLSWLVEQAAFEHAAVVAAGRRVDRAWRRMAARLRLPVRHWRRRRAARRTARELERRRMDGLCPACRFEVQGLPGERVRCANCGRGVRFPAAA